MKKYLLYAISLCGLYACNSGGGSSQCPTTAPLFNAEIGTSLINQWGTDAYAYSPYGSKGYTDIYTGAAYFTGAHYLQNAILLPTVSPVTRTNAQEIYDYFTNFLAHGPQMTNNPGTPESGGPYISQAGCGYGTISGYYNFTYQDGTTPTNARYTFQFQYIAESTSINITTEGGSSVGSVINIAQVPGWYIQLQNSAKLPATIGLPQNLFISN